MATRNLPDGSCTDRSDLYIETWRDLGHAVARVLGDGWRLTAFNPSLAFRGPNLESEHVSARVALAIQKLVKEKTVTDPTPNRTMLNATNRELLEALVKRGSLRAYGFEVADEILTLTLPDGTDLTIATTPDAKINVFDETATEVETP